MNQKFMQKAPSKKLTINLKKNDPHKNPIKDKFAKIFFAAHCMLEKKSTR